MKPSDWVASFLALLALMTSVWSGCATRTHDTLGARPHIQIAERFAPSSDRLGLEVVNVGPGIGIVDEFQLYLDGNALSGDWSDQWDTFRKATGTVDWTNLGLIRFGGQVG
jgi:hypothetical protein